MRWGAAKRKRKTRLTAENSVTCTCGRTIGKRGLAVHRKTEICKNETRAAQARKKQEEDRKRAVVKREAFDQRCSKMIEKGFIETTEHTIRIATNATERRSLPRGSVAIVVRKVGKNDYLRTRFAKPWVLAAVWSASAFYNSADSSLFVTSRFPTLAGLYRQGLLATLIFSRCMRDRRFREALTALYELDRMDQRPALEFLEERLWGHAA